MGAMCRMMMTARNTEAAVRVCSEEEVMTARNAGAVSGSAAAGRTAVEEESGTVTAEAAGTAVGMSI